MGRPKKTDEPLPDDKVDYIIEGLRKVNSRIDRLQKHIDDLDADRQIFENIEAALLDVKERLRLMRENADSSERSIKFEVGTVKDSVEGKVDEIIDQLEKKKVVRIQTYPKWMFWRQWRKWGR